MWEAGIRMLGVTKAAPRRWYARGHDPRRCPVSGRKPSAHERFWARVDRSDDEGCWLWTGPIRGNGYGGFYVDGLAFYAHRWAYVCHYGEDPGAFLVCHRCDNPSCVNPSHLFLGDHIDNARDMESKGRGGDRRNFGRRNGRAKITLADAATIRRRWSGGEAIAALARDFAVSTSTISDVVHRRRWT